VREAYHWDNTEVEDRLQIRPLDGVWNWSGSFEIDKAGEFGIRVRNAGTGGRHALGARHAESQTRHGRVVLPVACHAI
jgi:hypothetical protein